VYEQLQVGEVQRAAAVHIRAATRLSEIVCDQARRKPWNVAPVNTVVEIEVARTAERVAIRQCSGVYRGVDAFGRIRLAGGDGELLPDQPGDVPRRRRGIAEHIPLIVVERLKDACPGGVSCSERPV